jgi:ABC-type branched-subunit amino acid transport system permease subunit
LVSIGQQAFVGIGGYALLVFAMDLGATVWACWLAGAATARR